MPTLIQNAFPVRPPQGLALTLNIEPIDLRFFIDDAFGRHFFSRDENASEGEDAASNVARVYEAVGIPAPDKFVSLALRAGSPSEKVLRNYGTVVLELNLLCLAPEIVIFNGDVKNLGKKIEETNDNSWAVRVPFNGDVQELSKHLNSLVSNVRTGVRPRLVGNYFEVRLPRALVLSDVASIYIDVDDSDAIALAQPLCKMTSPSQ